MRFTERAEETPRFVCGVRHAEPSGAHAGEFFSLFMLNVVDSPCALCPQPTAASFEATIKAALNRRPSTDGSTCRPLSTENFRDAFARANRHDGSSLMLPGG